LLPGLLKGALMLNLMAICGVLEGLQQATNVHRGIKGDFVLSLAQDGVDPLEEALVMAM
jgi:hypothetical protein